MAPGATGFADLKSSIMDKLMKSARDRHPSGPQGAVDDRRRIGAEPLHPHLARAWTRRAPTPARRPATPRIAARRPWCSGPRLRRRKQGLGALRRTAARTPCRRLPGRARREPGHGRAGSPQRSGDGRPALRPLRATGDLAAQAAPRAVPSVRDEADAGLRLVGGSRKDIGDDAFGATPARPSRNSARAPDPDAVDALPRTPDPRRQHEGPAALRSGRGGPRRELDGNPRLLHYLSVPPSATPPLIDLL